MTTDTRGRTSTTTSAALGGGSRSHQPEPRLLRQAQEKAQPPGKKFDPFDVVFGSDTDEDDIAALPHMPGRFPDKGKKAITSIPDTTLPLSYPAPRPCDHEPPSTALKSEDDEYDPLGVFPSTIEQLDRLDSTFGQSSSRDAMRRKVEARKVEARDRHRPRSVKHRIMRKKGDEARVAVWEEEGWGTDPAEAGRVVGEWSYRHLEDYPLGLSSDMLGGRKTLNNKKVFTSTDLNQQDIQRLLLLEDSPNLFKALKDYAKALITTRPTEKHQYKYGPPGTKEVELQDQYQASWETEVVTPLTRWKYLPPSVREASDTPPKCRLTGDVLWTQKSRCYFHVVDKLALLMADQVRSDLRAAKTQYEDGCKFKPSWESRY
ncbi:hypothetical protein BJ508DRAFT_336954 [Ascobolus immersus RN42]|uniref:Uncharacterized protein n=1 Tax=Ascobolus immersus RN42 TaxID=1160509 RepID=A0A3N4H6T8_ASCIM|nr:hypothetical protein BJ508DRAFT_336954 [Ascobolus immersus RN42]